jgi:hypothetical protein
MAPPVCSGTPVSSACASKFQTITSACPTTGKNPAIGVNQGPPPPASCIAAYASLLCDSTCANLVTLLQFDFNFVNCKTSSIVPYTANVLGCARSYCPALLPLPGAGSTAQPLFGVLIAAVLGTAMASARM